MLDLVKLSAADLQALQTEGSITAYELVKQCLQQIEKYDNQGPKLRAMIAIAPEENTLQRAAFLDEERVAGRVRGPLHGIPVILKDIFNTHPDLGMPTTQGSWALAKCQHDGEALIVKKLLEAGMVIIGKTNLSEFGASKGPEGVGGLSGIGGQSQSVYVDGSVSPEDEPFAHTNPGGSSTGSAVGVAAGYSPISLGGEANGSIQTPASRSNLFSLRCTPQRFSTEGIFHVMPTVEALGAMAKTVLDLEEVTKVIFETAKSPTKLLVDSSKTWKDFKLGFVDPDLWRLPSELFKATDDYKRQIDAAYGGAQQTIQAHGGKIVYPVDIPHPSKIEGGFLAIFGAEFRNTVNTYLRNLPSSEMRSLADIIEFNKQHPELQAGISQDWFVSAQEDKTTPEEFEKMTRRIKKEAGEDGVFRVMDELDLDFICSCTDGPISEIAALAGSPTANVPLGYIQPSGRPFGLTILGRPGTEGKLLEVMYAFESTFPKRKTPKLVGDN